ncbi:replication initiation protein [Halospeciosus flavus]|uniref:Replication initiation protein n=1 Tax=Halospeciosus flavus TaxID=3032283 RepID=A0ABD5Z0A1_9EURY
MSNEIVKYDNELNTIPFRKFTSLEMNLFFSIVSRMRDQELHTVEFSFDQLRELSQYKPTSTKRFVDDLENTYRKMLQLTIGRRSSSVREFFVLFTGFKIDSENETVNIKVNEDLRGILNELNVWTRYSLKEFNSLKSTYSKTIFRLLKQYRTTGYLDLNMEDFKELLDLSDSYTLTNIDKRVLKPIKEELPAYFKNLSIEKKKSKKRGNKVIGFIFKFEKEENHADDFEEEKIDKQSSKN